MRDSDRGSSSVEAALVIPLLILIIAGLIKTGVVFEQRVIDASREYRREGALVSVDSLTNTEDFLRGRWVFE